MTSKIKLILIFCLMFSACTPRSNVRHDQDMERMKQEVSVARGDRADIEVMTEDLKVEVSRVRNAVEENAQGQRIQMEELRKEILAISARVEALEQHEVAEDERQANPPKAPEAPRGYDAAKRLFDDGRYSEAIEALGNIPKGKAKSEETKKAHFLLAESYFMSKDFASAALEFSEYKKNYPRDIQVPLATYRQANAFRLLGKGKEAKLFYQELMERFPKSSLVAKAKVEVKKIK